MSDEIKDKDSKIEKQPEIKKEWDESRVIVLIIGLSLIIEGVLIHYQAGLSQIVVSGATTLAGVTLSLFAWFVPFDIVDDADTIDTEESDTDSAIKELSRSQSEPLTKITDVPPTSEVIEKVISVEEVIESEKPVTKEITEEITILDGAKIETEAESQQTWFQRLSNGLSKTRTGFIGKLKKLVLGSTKIDGNLLDKLEEALFEADIGVKTTQELLGFLHKKVEEEDIKEPEVIYNLLRDQLRKRLVKYSSEPNLNPDGLSVFLIIGVNGVGKTTTIAKLAHLFVKEGKKVLLAAGDTFRAAAIDQLCIWGERTGVEVIRGNEGGDPGALVFDAIHAAKKRKTDILIIDTAGRMHVKSNLMAELKKIQKIAEKESNGGPHEILLVLDAATGQNAVQQAKQFKEVLPVSGLVVTKLDGTAKGGVLFAVEEQINVPVKFIGVGEKMDDLMYFDPEQFLEALFADDSEKSKESDYKVL